MRRTAPILAAALVLLGASTSFAQSDTSAHDRSLRLTLGGAWTSMWDDETHLGRGILLSGGIEKALGSHAAVEAELAAGRHHRDAGYLIADGTPILGIGRFAYRFGSRTSSARPFASVGIGLVHSIGTLTTRSYVESPQGIPLEGPRTARDWSFTRVPYELGAGVSIASSPSLAIRPEFRWIATGGNGQQTLLELPMWMMRAGVTIEWKLKR